MNVAIISMLDSHAQAKNKGTKDMDDKYKDLIDYIDYCIVTKGNFIFDTGYTLSIKKISDYDLQEITSLYYSYIDEDFTNCMFDDTGMLHKDLQKKFLYLLTSSYSQDFNDCLIGHALAYCEDNLQEIIDDRCVQLFQDLCDKTGKVMSFDHENSEYRRSA